MYCIHPLTNAAIISSAAYTVSSDYQTSPIDHFVCSPSGSDGVSILNSVCHLGVFSLFYLQEHISQADSRFSRAQSALTFKTEGFGDTIEYVARKEFNVIEANPDSEI
jgi:hypothetical protein